MTACPQINTGVPIMSLEATPLISCDDDEVEVEEEKVDFKQMVWFHGKASVLTIVRGYVI